MNIIELAANGKIVCVLASYMVTAIKQIIFYCDIKLYKLIGKFTGSLLIL